MSFIKHTSLAIQTCTKITRKEANVLLDRQKAINAVLRRTCSTKSTSTDETITQDRTSLGKAMKAFLQKVENYEKRMAEKDAEFAIGKRHLANMMGISMERFTQQDVNKSIEYLFPSSLTHKAALPKMVPPRRIYPRVDSDPKMYHDGRPKHTLFYTGKPNYYSILKEIGEEQIRLDNLLEKNENGESDSEEMQILLGGTTWIPATSFQKKFNEVIRESEYEFLIGSLTHLCQHPLSSLSQHFIMRYRKPTSDDDMRQMALILVENNRQFTFDSGSKKNATATVKVYRPGTGKFTINGYDILFFEEEFHRAAVIFPLLFTGLGMEVDVKCTIGCKRIIGNKKSISVPYNHHNRFEPYMYHPWASVYAHAIRLALSRALLPFVDEDMQERMRVAGLLTFDKRRAERKKVGQPGARKKHTWKAR